MRAFEKFSSEAKTVLTKAQEEAEAGHQAYIGTEHLLAGMLRVEYGHAYRVLYLLGVRLRYVRDAVSTGAGQGESAPVEGIVPTSRMKTVIEIAFQEARRMGSEEVDSRHLLLGLVMERDGVAARVLRDLGFPPERIIAAVEADFGLPPAVQGEPERPAESVTRAAKFRDVMGSFPSGVVVLTAFGDDGRPRGLTVSAFCAVSLEPPLALVCIDKTSNTLPAVQHTGGFTANILATGREQLARRMATKLSDKFDGLAWRKPESPIGGPILNDDCAAYAVCTLRDTIEAGDHWVLIGLVTEGDQVEGVTPMVFSRRSYR